MAIGLALAYPAGQWIRYALGVTTPDGGPPPGDMAIPMSAVVRHSPLLPWDLPVEFVRQIYPWLSHA